MSSSDSVGSLLADIANLVNEGLRLFSFADKRHWGPDEHEQKRALEVVLDEARRDFQELALLVNGQANYEHDRKHESLIELRQIRTKFRTHVHDLKDWVRTGGPINPTWVRETKSLQKDLHRAQKRAARRTFMNDQEASSRCLGGFIVRRKQRSQPSGPILDEAADFQRRHLEEVVACATVGTFQRFGEGDIAFVCDFCDGCLIWEDLEMMPTVRTEQNVIPPTPTTLPKTNPSWQATGVSVLTREEKQVVFAPLAVANHGVPLPMDFRAPLLCPYCEEDGEQPLDEDDETDPWRPDGEFEDIAALQEHFEWQHPNALSQAAGAGSSSNCQVM